MDALVIDDVTDIIKNKLAHEAVVVGHNTSHHNHQGDPTPPIHAYFVTTDATEGTENLESGAGN
jgi:hypothetical protein